MLVAVFAAQAITCATVSLLVMVVSYSGTGSCAMTST
jgi:hypothetical protein